jgi:hypothetical protein
VTTERLPADYQAFLQSIKTRVQHAQLKAVVAVNQELIVLYWQIGREILARQEQEGWGMCKTKNKVTAEYALANIHNPMGVATYRTTETLPGDLQDKLPDIKELEARLEEVPEESEEAQAR